MLKKRILLRVLTALAGALLLSTATPPAQAQSGLLVWDSLSAPAGTPLNGLATGSGWSGAWWTQNSDASVPGYSIGSGKPLSYSTLSTAGNYAVGGHEWLATGRKVDVASTGPLQQYLTGSQVGKSGTTVWASYLLRIDTPPASDEISVSLHSNSNVPYLGTPTWAPANIAAGYFGAASKSNGVAYWSLRVRNAVTRTSVPITAGQTVLIVIQAAFGHTNKVNLYLNPPLGGSAPAKASASATTASSVAFGAFAFLAGSSAGSASLDEIRIGSSFAAVTPTGGAPGVPPVLAGLTATPGPVKVQLAWTASAAATSYNVKRSGASGGPFTTISSPTGTAYTDSNVTPGTTYYYVVSAVNAGGESANSSPVSAVPQAAAVAPAITTQPKSQTVTAGQTASFSVAASGTAPLSYQWSKNGTAIGGATSTSYTTPATTTADSGSTFTVKVTNSAGSATSNGATLSVKQSLTPQTIAFNNPGAQTVGTPLTLSATASSGLTVSFTSSTTSVCTVSGGTATFVTAGTCSITASQSGNGTYAVAAPVTQSFTVHAALIAQSIAFANPGAQTVGTPLALVASASSGLTVSFASTTSSVCTVSGATATFVAAGTCSVQATQAGNATYAAATPVQQSFTVNAAPIAQSITFANPGAQTVGTPLTLSAAATSGLTVSFTSTTTSVCTVGGTTATFTASGTCTIQATQPGNATYAAATPVNQSFTVNPAPPVPITSIAIPSAATVAVGETTTITPTVLPAKAANRTLTWNSGDTTIATVSAAGVVTGIMQGTVTVTATATDGSGVVSNDCTVTVTAATSVQSNYFGINISTDLDWDNNRMFADAMKSSRAWGTSSDAGATLPTSALDVNGWPTQDASLYVWAGIDRMQGTYALSFNGQATVQPSSGSIANQAYNSSTNLTKATLTYTASDSNYLTLAFTNTKRTSSSSTNTGITNVVLMRPSAVGSATPLPATQVFNPPFLAALSDFAALRTMDFSATNGNEIVHWSDRTRPGDASQAIGNPGVPVGGWEGPGGAWEYAILLANQTNKDLWINVPLNADDDYITKLAQLTKYGSDGTTPYTSLQTSPVWPGLNSNLHLYVEFSNEVWNTAGAFAGTENHTEAVAEVNAGGSPLKFDGDTNDWNWAWRRSAEKTVQISTIFRSVWGDAAMMTTVRPVLESQLGYADGPLLQEMHLMVDYYYNPAEVSSPHPPSYYIYGLGGSAYYNPTDKSSVDSIFSTMATGFVSAVENDVDYALPFGVRRIAYEGGPSLDSTGDSSQDANQAAAWADSRMEQAIVTEQNAWSQSNGDLLVYFYLAGGYEWGFMPDVLSPSSPKMSGIADILASPRSASTYGTPIPATLAASNANVPPAWLWSDGSKMHDYKWTGFSVLVSTQGAFTVSLTADSATSGAQAEILVDGNSIGTVTVPSSGNTSALSTPTLSVGSHGILVRSLTGTFNLTHVVVQTGVTTPGAQTIAFGNPGAQTVGTPLTLSATASSGLTVSFDSTTATVCTVSGTTAAFVAAGTCTIQATQAGNGAYAAAAVSQSFTVSVVAPKSQTIAFGNPGAQTVGTPLTLSATASSGLTVSFASTTATVCTVSGTTAALVSVGTCTIQATQAGDSTYAAATPVTRSFAVNAASVTSAPQLIGNRILDIDGNRVVGRGPEMVVASTGNVGDVDTIAGWGANSVRMLLTLDAANGMTPADFDSVVGEAVKKHMMVWISLYMWNNSAGLAIGDSLGGGSFFGSTAPAGTGTCATTTPAPCYLAVWQRQWLKDLVAKYSSNIIVDGMQEFIGATQDASTEAAREEWRDAAITNIGFFRNEGYRQPIEIMTNFQGRDLYAIHEFGDAIRKTDTVTVNGDPQTMFGWQAYWGTTDGYYPAYQGSLFYPNQNKNLSAADAIHLFATEEDFPIEIGIDNYGGDTNLDYQAEIDQCATDNGTWLWWSYNGDVECPVSGATCSAYVKAAPNGFGGASPLTAP